ncbi:MAG TPA: lipid A deacylase LpxR family protein [Sediminibacterium sp.]|nr:lipid A deacylase LpxR family protein [Sediminibacterium sp.]
MNRFFLCCRVAAFICFCLLFQTAGNAQKSNELQFMKLSEDDDFLNFRGEGTDRAYTSGLKFEMFFSKRKAPGFPSNLLMKVSGNVVDNLYGWGISQYIYTPNEIDKTTIQYGERPYCGITYATHSLVSTSLEKKQKLTTGLSLGVIGKYSFAGDAQNIFHGLINYQKPLGWDNQIKTDVIINYGILYEHLLFNPTPNLEVIGNLAANAGTLVNNIGLGVQFRSGIFNSYFSQYERPVYHPEKAGAGIRKAFQFYLFMKLNGTAVMDDATLQGGFFSHRSSPYVISKDSISRFIMQYEYGFMLSHKRFGFSFSEKLRTAEFKGTYAQQVGNITLYYGL